MDTLLVTISGPEGADQETLAFMGQSLAAELSAAADVEAQPRRSGVLGQGSKSGTALDIGTLVVTGIFSAATMTAISEVLRVWITRRRAGVITLVKGELKLEVKGLTEEQLEQELATLISLFQQR